MKKILFVLASLFVLSLTSGCALLGGSTGTATDLSNLPLVKFTHTDLQTAAAYATANGFPARAAVYQAIEIQLTACEQAIAAVGPKTVPNGTVGAFTLFEMGAEAVGQGIPANVKINCGAITLPTL
jgi:hypothetical protein